MAAIRWTDNATSLLLESLQSRESLWNTKIPSYKNRNTKKTEYGELIEILKTDMPDIDLAALKGKIQSLRTTFREEVRKIKKSEGTGTGSADVYIPKWKFFDECSFLEDVIISNRPCFTNMSRSASTSSSVCDDGTSIDSMEDDTGSGLSVTPPPPQELNPKRKKSKIIPWTETAASALNELAKGSGSHEEDEWEIFGRDVANSLRSLQNVELQRRAKFAVQTAIFQSSQTAVPQPILHPTTMPYNLMSTYQNSDNQYGGF